MKLKTKLLIACSSLFSLLPSPFSLLPSLAQDRPVHSTLMFDMGFSKTRDTYLTPLLYNGSQLGVRYERFRLMRGEKLYNQQIIDADFASGDAEQGKHSSMWTGRAMYRYAMHWQLLGKKEDRNLKLFLGPYAGIEGGFNYNLKLANGNNPATARYATNFGASVIISRDYSLRGKACSVDFQAQMPLVGITLMPEYGESYYEAFMVDKNSRVMHYTSLHNQQDLDMRLTSNIPLSVIPWFKKLKTVVRVGGYYHIETMDINHIVTRYSTAGITIGWTWKHLPL